jgi:serine/threonine protein kinase
MALSYDYANINDKEMQRFKEEARRMQAITPHPNIVPFYGVILQPTFAIVCQFCEGGSLDAVLYKSNVSASEFTYSTRPFSRIQYR